MKPWWHALGRIPGRIYASAAGRVVASLPRFAVAVKCTQLWPRAAQQAHALQFTVNHADDRLTPRRQTGGGCGRRMAVLGCLDHTSPRLVLNRPASRSGMHGRMCTWPSGRGHCARATGPTHTDNNAILKLWHSLCCAAMCIALVGGSVVATPPSSAKSAVPPCNDTWCDPDADLDMR